MSEKKQKLSDGLREIMDFTDKYKFTEKDFLLLFERTLLLGEALVMIQDLGLFEELAKKHEEKCKIAAKVLYPE